MSHLMVVTDAVSAIWICAFCEDKAQEVQKVQGAPQLIIDCTVWKIPFYFFNILVTILSDLNHKVLVCTLPRLSIYSDKNHYFIWQHTRSGGG